MRLFNQDRMKISKDGSGEGFSLGSLASISQRNLILPQGDFYLPLQPWNTQQKTNMPSARCSTHTSMCLNTLLTFQYRIMSGHTVVSSILLNQTSNTTTDSSTITFTHSTTSLQFLLKIYNIRQIRFNLALCYSCRLIKETGTLHKANARNRSLHPTTDKLLTLDLYSGCGGLSYGLEKSGLTKSKWAVEIDRSAADAFQKNFPHCHVFNEDVTDWFQRVQVPFPRPLLPLS